MRRMLIAAVLLAPCALRAEPPWMYEPRPRASRRRAGAAEERAGFLKRPVDGAFGPGSPTALDDWREAEGRIVLIGAPLPGADLVRLGKAFGAPEAGEIPRKGRDCAFARGREAEFCDASKTRLHDAVRVGAAQAAKEGEVHLATASSATPGRTAWRTKSPAVPSFPAE